MSAPIDHTIDWVKDKVAVVASVALFCTFIVYGASAASLGAAIPSMNQQFHTTNSAMGLSFTLRGIGYLIGTLTSAWYTESKTITHKLSKELLVCLATIGTGLTLAAIQGIQSYAGCMVLYFFQGIGFGFIDTLANCLMPELWKLRVGPWMQCLHSCFGIGAIIGPVLVGSLNFNKAFIIICIISIVPTAFLLIAQLINTKKVEVNSDGNNVELAGIYGSSNDVEKSDKDSMEQMNSTLIVEETKISDELVRKPPALSIKILMFFFFFLYVGCECAYGGWIPTYLLEKGTTTSYSAAAYAAAIYWALLTTGRVLAIPIALKASATTMLRTQLVLCVLGVVLIAAIAARTYMDALVASGVFGFALSSIFPLGMVIMNDYGFLMDTATTTIFVVGSTFGEALVPVVVGIAMNEGEASTPNALPLALIISIAVIITIYIAVHNLAKKTV